jgi:hypothetical protein
MQRCTAGDDEVLAGFDKSGAAGGVDRVVDQATGLVSAFRTRLIFCTRSRKYSLVPCEKLRRATFIPAKDKRIK